MSVPVPDRVGDGQPATDFPAADVSTADVSTADVSTADVSTADVSATVLTNAVFGAQPPGRRRLPAARPKPGPDAEPKPDL